MKAVRLMPSDPRFESVQHLLAMLNVLANPACDFFALPESRRAEWAADAPATREHIEAELEKILGSSRNE